VQSQLGDVHDCDVWIERLPHFIGEERERHERFFGHLRGFKKVETGLLFLEDERKARRELLYKDFVEFWDTQVQAGKWRKLRASLTGKASPNALTDAGRNPDDTAKNMSETDDSEADAEPQQAAAAPKPDTPTA